MVLTLATNLIYVLNPITSSVSQFLCPLANTNSNNTHFLSFIYTYIGHKAHQELFSGPGLQV